MVAKTRKKNKKGGFSLKDLNNKQKEEVHNMIINSTTPIIVNIRNEINNLKYSYMVLEEHFNNILNNVERDSLSDTFSKSPTSKISKVMKYNKLISPNNSDSNKFFNNQTTQVNKEFPNKNDIKS